MFSGPPGERTVKARSITACYCVRGGPPASFLSCISFPSTPTALSLTSTLFYESRSFPLSSLPSPSLFLSPPPLLAFVRFYPYSPTPAPAGDSGIASAPSACHSSQSPRIKVRIHLISRYPPPKPSCKPCNDRTYSNVISSCRYTLFHRSPCTQTGSRAETSPFTPFYP